MAENSKEEILHTSIRLPKSLLTTLYSVADLEGKSRSEVCREMLERGLSAAGYISGSEDQNARMYRMISDAIKPQADRMASISAKAAQISAASFFIFAWLARQTLPPDLLPDLQDKLDNARRLGAQYLKVSKDRTLDDFIASGLRQLEGDDT